MKINRPERGGERETEKTIIIYYREERDERERGKKINVHHITTYTIKLHNVYNTLAAMYILGVTIMIMIQ